MTTDAPGTGTQPDPTNTPPSGDTPPPDTGTQPTDWEAEAKKWQELARKHEARAKANAAAAKERDELKQSMMSEQEKAIEQARNEARVAALREAGAKIAAAEVRAAAAGRLGDEQLTTLLEGLNLAAFINDDGEVDLDKVRKFVDGIAPAPVNDTPQPPSFDLGQGARGTAKASTGSHALSGTQFEADLRNKLGIG